MTGNATLFDKVSWLRHMLPPKLADQQFFCVEVNNEIRKSNGGEWQYMNPECYRAVVIAIASQALLAKVGMFWENHREYLAHVQNGWFPRIREAGADVLNAVEAHLLQVQIFLPITDQKTIRLWTTEIARVILRHLPADAPELDSEAITRWEEDGGRPAAD